MPYRTMGRATAYEYSKRGHVHVDDPVLNTPRVCCAGVGKEVGKEVNPDWG